eukprot:scaffold1214_cov136-Isochrysis_galbana.AAC.3
MLTVRLEHGRAAESVRLTGVAASRCNDGIRAARRSDRQQTSYKAQVRHGRRHNLASRPPADKTKICHGRSHEEDIKIGGDRSTLDDCMIAEAQAVIRHARLLPLKILLT